MASHSQADRNLRRGFRRAAILALAAGAAAAFAPARAVAATLPGVQATPLGPNSVTLSWEHAAPGYILQQADSPAASALWRGIATVPTVAGNQRQVPWTLPDGAPRQFFRLRPSGAPAALDQLLALQDPSGLWSPDSSTTARDTAAALEALARFGVSTPGTGAGAGALAGWTARNNDDLARQTRALADLGTPVTAARTQLLAAQNGAITDPASLGYPGRGWGLAAGFGSSPIDTALVRDALRAAGLEGGLAVGAETVPDGSTSPVHPFTVVPGATGVTLFVQSVTGGTLRFVLTPPGSGALFVDISPAGAPVNVAFPDVPGTWTLAVQNLAGGASATYSASVGFTGPDAFDYFRLTAPRLYLARSQNPDGGWGVGPASDSHLMITAEVLRSLARAGTGFVGATTVNNAAAWISARQNPDGGFSSTPGTSNLGETLAAVLALKEAGATGPLTAAIDFLRGQQLPDGSWGGDPYLTALGAQALHFPPTLGTIPGQTVVSPAAFATISLDPLVSDFDDADDQLAWTVTGNTVLGVSIANRIVTLTYPPGTAVSETLTFTVTDPAGLSDSATATFTVTAVPPVDHIIARGGSASGSRSFTGDAGTIAQTAFYTVSESGIPANVTYQTTGVYLISATEVGIDYLISVGGAAALGDFNFQVDYGLNNNLNQPLGPFTGDVMPFSIRVTP